MFWDSVGLGLKALLSWQIWAGMFSVGFISFLPTLVTALMVSSAKSDKTAGAGYLFMMIGPPVIQAIAISAFVLFLFPAILAGQGFTPLEIIPTIAGTVFKSGMAAMFIVLLLCFMPIVGNFIVNTPGLTVFLQGIFIFKPISRTLLTALLDTRIPNDVYPGFFACSGYFVIGVVLTVALMFILTIVTEKIKKVVNPGSYYSSQYGNEPTGLDILIGQFIGPMLGIIPLLMYGKYVVLGLEALTK